jgi:putative peptidoglycan lipid II flippase
LILGYLFALPLPPLLGIDQRWGVAGLTLSAGIAGWIEFMLLRRALHRQIGVVEYSVPRVLKLWLAAIVAALIGYGIKRVLPFHRPLLVGPAVLIPYGAIYLAMTQMMGISMLGGLMRRFMRR